MPGVEKNLEKIVLTRVLRLNAKIQSLVTGIVAGVTIFFATNWLVVKGAATGPEGEPVVGPHLALLGQYFIGYSVSFFGSLIGFAYGFGVGFAAGYLISTIYNWLVDRHEQA